MTGHVPHSPRRRSQTPSQRSESRIDRPTYEIGSSLENAVSVGISDFWRDLCSRAPSDESVEVNGDVIAKVLLTLYSPQDLLFNANDERMFQAEDTRWSPQLDGDESSDTLVRAFASAAGLRTDEVERGIRGTRVAVLQELLRSAERFKNRPDLILAILKGVLVRTLKEHKALGSPLVFGCEAVSGVLDHAWPVVNSKSRYARLFLSELASHTCKGLETSDWRDMIEVAHQVIELIERADAEEMAVDLAMLWHRLLQSMVKHAKLNQKSVDRTWLRWFSWLALGYASHLQHVNADGIDSTDLRLTDLVDRLAEYGVIAAMRSILRRSMKISPQATVSILVEGIGIREEGRSWMVSPHDYQQFIEAILCASPCWEAKFAWSRTSRAMLMRVFHCGITAVAAQIVEDDEREHVTRWFDVANAISVFRCSVDDAASAEDRALQLELANLRMAEESFVWWLALGVALHLKKNEFVAYCLQWIWSHLENLLGTRQGYNPANPPAGLNTVREQTLIWLEEHAPKRPVPLYAKCPMNVRDSIKRLTGEILPDELKKISRSALNLSEEYEATFTSLFDLIGTFRKSKILVCPSIARNDGDGVGGFNPAVAKYWRQIFESLSDRENESSQWTALMMQLSRDIATLHAEADGENALVLTDVFAGKSPITALVSQRKVVVDPDQSTWDAEGPFGDGWSDVSAPSEPRIEEWLQKADFTFLREPQS